MTASGLAYRPGSCPSTSAAWLTPMPSRNRSGYAAVDARVAFAGLLDRVHPEVEDARRDGNVLGGTEDVLAILEDRAADAARDPQRGVSQGLELGRSVANRSRIAVAKLEAPDADPTELHGVPPSPGGRPVKQPAATADGDRLRPMTSTWPVWS